ncbi:Zinc finger RING-type domain containing protein [Klebsormidium nitens]|uniref:Zinc finger RING-type domain containing protein n=1 Tax=Klebsormidium nitens TaxID=105231 RepID=A0A1Y1HMQ3_KLENI|nr:Zinc finger RING-type domain containing protein [Klebsormidium nitens]|eukprot:GAQ79905.1 Zinc finger RING-type domain containing protein [Klebsormidium nitens]
MTEEVASGWRGPGDSAQAEARRERRRKGQEGKAPWQPIVLPDDDEEDRPASSARSGPPRPPSAQRTPSNLGLMPSNIHRFDPEMLAPAAFRRIAARLHAQQQSMWSARQAGGSGSVPAGAGPSGRAPAASIDLTDDCVVLDEASGSSTLRGVKRRRTETPSPSLPPELRPGFVEPPPKPDREVKFTCSICLENMKEEATTICGHIFCKQCILDSIKATKKCPTCRKKLSSKDVHRIYLQSSAL